MKKLILFTTLLLVFGSMVAQTAADFRTEAEKGNADAQFNLGVCYANGDGVTRDESKAVDLYIKASAKGHIKAAYKLGVHFENLYFEFIGSSSSTSFLKTAVRNYTKAADKGYAPAQHKLGVIYANYFGSYDDFFENGVYHDEPKAIDLWTKAANQEYENAQMELADYYERHDEIKQAAYWYNKAATKGNKKAKEKLEELKK